MKISKINCTIIFSLTVLSQVYVYSQTPVSPKMIPEMTEFWEPEVEVITPGSLLSDNSFAPPSDAIVLFDGKNLLEWEGEKETTASWVVQNKVFTVKKGSGSIQTKRKFEDFQLHIEWSIPKNITGSGQSRGNSGIFLQNIYEIQILDNYKNRTYSNGQAGSVYKQTPPLKNVMKPPGDWNVYEIIYTAPRFKEDHSLFSRARVTVIHNGVVIQNNTVFQGNTPYIGLPKYSYHGKGPIRLQDHGDPSEPISFRNIWIREL